MDLVCLDRIRFLCRLDDGVDEELLGRFKFSEIKQEQSTASDGACSETNDTASVSASELVTPITNSVAASVAPSSVTSLGTSPVRTYFESLEDSEEEEWDEAHESRDYYSRRSSHSDFGLDYTACDS